MPRSSAACTTLREASRLIRPPNALQPSPTSETWRPDFPRLRFFIGTSLAEALFSSIVRLFPVRRQAGGKMNLKSFSPRRTPRTRRKTKGNKGQQRITKDKRCHQDHKSGDCIGVHIGIDFLGVLSVLCGSNVGFGINCPRAPVRGPQ